MSRNESGQRAGTLNCKGMRGPSKALHAEKTWSRYQNVPASGPHSTAKRQQKEMKAVGTCRNYCTACVAQPTRATCHPDRVRAICHVCGLAKRKHASSLFQKKVLAHQIWPSLHSCQRPVVIGSKGKLALSVMLFGCLLCRSKV